MFVYTDQFQCQDYRLVLVSTCQQIRPFLAVVDLELIFHLSVSFFFPFSVEGDPQCTDTASFSDSTCSQGPYLGNSDRYGNIRNIPGPQGPPVAPSSPASLAWAQRTRHQPASLALRKQEEEESKRCKALSDSYELSTDLQDKKVWMCMTEKHTKSLWSLVSIWTCHCVFTLYHLSQIGWSSTMVICM